MRTISLSLVWPLLVTVLLSCLPAFAESSSENPARDGGYSDSGLAVLDWTMLETLIALGHPPVAAADLEGYRTWVGQPSLPEQIVDIGLRTQPNLELLSQLELDQFLVPPMFSSLEPILSRIAPVEVLPLYSAEGPLWERLRQFTRGLASYTPEPESADLLIQKVEARLAEIAEELPEDTPPLLIVQFMDDRHVRVFGEHSLYSAVLDRLGLETAWQGKTHYWGFSLVGIEALAEAGNLLSEDARMVVIEPLPAGVEGQLEQGGLWRSLPAVQRNDVLYLPPAWSFGGLPSALRFAELLNTALAE